MACNYQTLPAYTEKCQSLLKLLCGDHHLHANGRSYILCTTKCVLCDMFVEKDISYMLESTEHTRHCEIGFKELERV